MLFGKKLLNRLDMKFGRYAIRNLMTFIVIGMGFVFLASYMSNTDLIYMLAFIRPLITEGEIWRVISFIFLPPNSSPLFIIFSLYLYWIIGKALEREWGAFKFNVYYLCGVLGAIISGCLTGIALNHYLNLSLYFAFAALYPNFELLLFFILPIKIKYIAYFMAAIYLLDFIGGDNVSRLALLMSLINFVIFFGGDFMNGLHQMKRRRDWKKTTGGWGR